MLHEEVTKYNKLTGEDGWMTPVIKVGAYLDGYDKGRKDGIEEGENKASDIIIKNVIASLQEIKRGYRNLDEYIEQLMGCVR